MKFANATKFYRKSGEAEGSAVPLSPQQLPPEYRLFNSNPPFSTTASLRFGEQVGTLAEVVAINAG
jgi:hypothetical protein